MRHVVELTMNENNVLHRLLSNRIGGSPDGPRRHIDSIIDKLIPSDPDEYVCEFNNRGYVEIFENKGIRYRDYTIMPNENDSGKFVLLDEDGVWIKDNFSSIDVAKAFVDGALYAG